MSTARDRLLERLLSTFGDELPPQGASLREIAARVGTSHALLRYHFGSHAGLLAAMLVGQRARDNTSLAGDAESASYAELVERIWALYTDPQRMDRLRGFFLVAGLAAQDPEAFEEFVASLNDLSGLLAEVARREGAAPAEASLRATVTTAALRGLLLQQVLAPGTVPLAAVHHVLEFSKAALSSSRR